MTGLIGFVGAGLVYVSSLGKAERFLACWEYALRAILLKNVSNITPITVSIPF